MVRKMPGGFLSAKGAGPHAAFNSGDGAPDTFIRGVAQCGPRERPSRFAPGMPRVL